MIKSTKNLEPEAEWDLLSALPDLAFANMLTFLQAPQPASRNTSPPIYQHIFRNINNWSWVQEEWRERRYHWCAKSVPFLMPFRLGTPPPNHPKLEVCLLEMIKTKQNT